MRIRLRKAVRFLAAALALLVVLLDADAQTQAMHFRFSGVVVDGETQEALPYVPVQVFGITDTTAFFGANSDISGRYDFRLPEGEYLVKVQYASYQLLELKLQLHEPQEGIRLVLRPVESSTEEITISAKDNPAKRLMKKVIAAKDRHRMSRFNSLAYKSYSKLVISFSALDSTDLDDTILKRARDLILKEGLDTLKSDSTTRRYKLALYIAETYSQTFFQQPNSKRDVILGSRDAGVSNDVNLTMVNSMFTPFDINDDVIDIANRGFISPLASGALMNYEYFIEQTVRLPHDTIYYVGLYPKNPFDRAFKGVLEISAHDLVVRSATLRMNRDPLINFVSDIRIAQRYDKVNGEWVQVESDIQIDLIEIFFGKAATARQAYYRTEYELNPTFEPNFFRHESVAIEPGALTRDDAFWEKNTLVPLDKSELLAQKAADTLRHALFWKATDFGLNLLMGGVLRVGKWMLGPYNRAFTNNPVEGTRLQIGIYTNPDYFDRWDLSGYVAHGFRDQRWKYHVDIGYALNRNPLVEIAVRRTDDIEQTGFANYFIDGLSFLNTTLARVPLNNLNYYTLNQARLLVDAFPGASFGASITQKYFEPAVTFPFSYPREQSTTDSLRTYTTTRLQFNARLSIRERYIKKGNKKIYLTTPFPILYLKGGIGMKGVLGGEFPHSYVEAAITNRYALGRYGRIIFTAQYGRIWGSLPYPSLQVFQGSQTWAGYSLGQPSDIASSVTGRVNRTDYYPPLNYNLLYFYEFITDEYAQAGFDWYVDGWLIKKLPLVRYLKVKEVVTFRTAWGRLSDENRQRNLIDGIPAQAPDGFPYVEMGFGLEGILKIFRVDYVWRMNYRSPRAPNNLPQNTNFNSGFRFGFRVAF